jgi:hypothetical protein
MERQLNLLSVSNLNLGYILRKSENLLTKCNFTSDFKNFCQISLLINPPNLYIQIKFPTYFTQSHTRLVYDPSNPEFPIEKALNSNEILHNEDQDYEGNTIKFSEFPSNDNSVSFSYSPGIVTSLLISLLEGTYEEGLLNIVTNRRGNKEIVGILKRVKKHRIFKKMPKNLEFQRLLWKMRRQVLFTINCLVLIGAITSRYAIITLLNVNLILAFFTLKERGVIVFLAFQEIS